MFKNINWWKWNLALMATHNTDLSWCATPQLSWSAGYGGGPATAAAAWLSWAASAVEVRGGEVQEETSPFCKILTLFRGCCMDLQNPSHITIGALNSTSGATSWNAATYRRITVTTVGSAQHYWAVTATDCTSPIFLHWTLNSVRCLYS